MIEQILNYCTGLNANQEVVSWVNTTGKKAMTKHKATVDDLEHIVDYLISQAAPKRLQKMSYVDAKRKCAEWTKTNQKKGKNLVDSDDDIETVHDFLDGTKIVKLLSQKAYKREGFLMSHCVGGYSLRNDVHIYSYRDEKNLPHATFEVQKNSNEIVQIKGKGNGSIHPKYIHPILAFLKVIGMEIRPYDMRNLGYYHVEKDYLPYLKGTDLNKKIIAINGEMYVND